MTALSICIWSAIGLAAAATAFAFWLAHLDHMRTEAERRRSRPRARTAVEGA